ALGLLLGVCVSFENARGPQVILQSNPATGRALPRAGASQSETAPAQRSRPEHQRAAPFPSLPANRQHKLFPPDAVPCVARRAAAEPDEASATGYRRCKRGPRNASRDENRATGDRRDPGRRSSQGRARGCEIAAKALAAFRAAAWEPA